MPKLVVDSFLADFSGSRKKEIRASESGMLKLFCWNLCNPSIERAKKQAAWLSKQPFDIFCFTETKDSDGCNFIERYFRARGFFVDFPKPKDGGYGAMVISRIPFSSGILSGFGSERVNSIQLSGSSFEIVNAYVPNNRENGKKMFLENLASSLKSAPRKSFIFCGDLNIIEPGHVPHYPKFESWEYDFYKNIIESRLHDAFRSINPKANEYSWVGRTGDGYRYDHCFVSEDLVPGIRECYYLHEPRISRLSDHSGLVVNISLS